MDYILNIIACKESIWFCGPCGNDKHCTSYTEVVLSIELNEAMTKLSEVFNVHNGTEDFKELSNVYALVALSAYMTSIPGSIQHRQAPAALQVARYLETIVQYYLGPEQWKIELEYWFIMALASLQFALFNTIGKSSGVNASEANIQWDGSALKQLCGRVKFHSPNHTTLSTVGLITMLCGVVLLTLLTFLDVVLGWLSPP
ncbi:hypothetical protein EK21DRAFT_86622 [Setomelanomma holmii]|uniref:Uncharacterized protein n=1 Tax=Setomelanomma holmii TaxID=210430 RepID=A0A9P4LPI3_9PLEO|nr:hypothetical protein EK21DRAFT_86622 [Setomelanomma holmii]